MDFSNMIIRPALNRITSSFASSSSTTGFITRVLSFTGSFNSRTSLLHEHDVELGLPTQTEEAGAAYPPPPPPEAPEAAEPAAASSSVRTTTAAGGHPFDIEAGTTTTTPLDPEGLTAGQEEPAATEIVDAESKRIGKSVNTVCLFVASASLVLFANLPENKQQQQPGGAAPPPAGQAGQHGLLYIAEMAFISLGLFSSLGLCMFSIVARPGGEAASSVGRARVQKWGMVVAVASVVVAFALRVCMVPAAAA